MDEQQQEHVIHRALIYLGVGSGQHNRAPTRTCAHFIPHPSSFLLQFDASAFADDSKGIWMSSANCWSY